MKEMLTQIGWSMVCASEEAMKRLPKKYIKKDFLGREETYFDQCMDKRVIALAKEMGFDFLGDGNYEGFRIISWEETEVMPMFFEGEYGDTELVFVTRESAKSNEDFEHYFVGNNYNTDSFDWKYMQKILKNYDVIDYEPTEIRFTIDEKYEKEEKELKERLKREEEERKRKKEQERKEIQELELPKDKLIQITLENLMEIGFTEEKAILVAKEWYYHKKKTLELYQDKIEIQFNDDYKRPVVSLNPLTYIALSKGNSWSSCHSIDRWRI